LILILNNYGGRNGNKKTNKTVQIARPPYGPQYFVPLTFVVVLCSKIWVTNGQPRLPQGIKLLHPKSFDAQCLHTHTHRKEIRQADGETSRRVVYQTRVSMVRFTDFPVPSINNNVFHQFNVKACAFFGRISCADFGFTFFPSLIGLKTSM